ncbi:Uncharacterised protein [Bordetella pertussis]|nr:Uncharacterised protein [Bordetella pertussis]CFO74196.1 Uncharacterised protein [Bordetella pertussis]CFU83808.1 Uncharacterised protein [Bordetella pertussis]CPI12335.1 Uncharacterised protein [Bordetella pertussis]CPK99394.1 Uncharacterised protein [Bordetella pertussis]
MRIFRPLRSSGDLISLRYQPPICTPVLPIGKLTIFSGLNISRVSFMPSPSNIQAFIWRAFRPNGTAESKQ